MFAETLINECDVRAVAPYSGTRYDLAAGKFIVVTEGIPISKATEGRRVSNAFVKLKMTGKQVMEFITNKCSGLPNKDMEKFTRDLEALIEKYKR